MLILSSEAPAERQEEMIERVRQLIVEAGGSVEHANDWGPRRIAYPMAKQADGRYVVFTCTAPPAVLEEIGRVLSIAKDVVVRYMPIRLEGARIERARANGAPMPVDDRPEGGFEPARPGRGGGSRRRSRSSA